MEQTVDVPELQIIEDILEAVEITPKEHISERILEQFVEAFHEPVFRFQEENVEVIKRSVGWIIHQKHISERTQNVDATVSQIMEKLQERISERMHEQNLDVPVPLDQPGDQACRVPAVSIHRQGFCRYACGDAAKGPSDSRCVEDRGSPVGAARRQSCGCARDHADHAVDATTGPSDSRCAEEPVGCGVEPTRV